MLPSAVELYKSVKRLHGESYEKLCAVNADVAKTADVKELADVAFAVMRAHQYVDDLRKELEKTRKLSERIACLLWAKLDTPAQIKTKHVTANPELKTMVKIPNRKDDREQYAKLMEHFKIAEELWDAPAGAHPAVHLSWKGLIEYFSELNAKGLPLPEGVDPAHTYEVCELRMTGKKEPDAA